MRRAFAVFVAGFLVMGLSCGVPPSPTFCAVSEPESCRPDNVRHGCDGDEACGDGRTCVESTRSSGITYAACAVGGKAGFDERCDRDGDVTICEGETWVSCHGRYHEKEVDCQSLGLVCEQLRRPRAGAFGDEPIAKCVESHVVDEGCAAVTKGSTLGTRCEDETRVTCFGPFVLDRIACGDDGRFCRETSANGAACVLTGVRDSRCIGRPPGDATYCDGDVAVRCLDGWRIETKDCAAEGKRCAELRDEGSSSPAVRCE